MGGGGGARSGDDGGGGRGGLGRGWGEWDTAVGTRGGGGVDRSVEGGDGRGLLDCKRSGADCKQRAEGVTVDGDRPASRVAPR